MVGRLVSFWGSFLAGAMLVSGSVFFKTQNCLALALFFQSFCCQFSEMGPTKPFVNHNNQPPVLAVSYKQADRWWQLKYFLNFHPDPWGNDQI